VTLFGDGLVAGPDLEDAAQRAVQQAVGPLDGPPALVCVFVTGAEPDAAVRAGLRAMAVAAEAGDDRTTVLGCTASGVIGGGRGVERESAVSAWATALPGVRLTPFRLRTSRTPDSLQVTGMPAPSPEDRIAVLLADPFRFPVDAFVEHSADALGGLPITGGLAAPEARLFLDGEVHRGGAVGVMLGGPVEVATVVSQGCRPVGPAMVVTRAAGNEVAELAGTPALAKLDEIVGDLPGEERKLAASGIHLGIAIDEYAEHHERGDFLVRPVSAADTGSGTLTIGDVVEVGQTVRFQVRDAATAAADLERLLTVFRPVSGIDPVGGALLFSCDGRGTSLFGSPEHDVTAVRRALEPQAAGGFFAAGEIGPVGGRNHVHGYTASILVFGSGGGTA
jgi:small ligand-binding sensory domain FIST